MLTPQDITNTTLKSGMGYKKKEVEAFLLEVQNSFLELYKENEELKEKASVLSEGVQYYKNLEKTLQKSLVLAEKTSNETITTAEAKARAIEQEAKTKANMMINDAQKELNQIHNQIISLLQQYEKYKTQCRQFASTQLELLDSSSYELKIPNLDELISPITENSLNVDKEKEKKKVSVDLKEDMIHNTDLIKSGKIQKKTSEEDEISKIPEISANTNVTTKTPEVSANISVTAEAPEVSANTFVTAEKKDTHTRAENIDTRSTKQSDTQPLPEVKEIFMNAHKEEKFLNKESAVPDMEQRNAAKEAGFSFSDEEEVAKQKDFSEMSMNNHNQIAKEDDMEIDVVLSKLKKSFK